MPPTVLLCAGLLDRALTVRKRDFSLLAVLFFSPLHPVVCNLLLQPPLVVLDVARREY